MSDEQPIDLDDLRRVSEMVREQTADNWLADMVELAAAEIERLREERRWISVEERLPELNEANRFRVSCLVSCKGGAVCEMDYEINTYAKREQNKRPRWKWHGMMSMQDVTHWMALPAPQEEEKQP